MMDMAIHHQHQTEAMEGNIAPLTNRIAAESFLPFPEGTAMVASFGHLAGYDAGYYGYAWADVIAADLAEKFSDDPDGYLNPALGSALRKELFSPGNSRDVNLSVRAFLGRDSTPDAFGRLLGIDESKPQPPAEAKQP
jgi:Zn-dependent oligopeptidase